MSTKQDTVAQLVKPSYNPTSEELNQAISAALKQEGSPSPSIKQVLTTLQEDHPTWKLPERRVTKFCKKQIKSKQKDLKDTGTQNADEESLHSQTSMARRMAQSTKKKLSRVMKRVKKMNKTTSSPEKKPPSHIQTDNMTADTSNIVSPLSDVGEDDTPAKVENPTVEEEDDKQEEVPRDVSVVYEDDNDGSKEGQFCGGICACTIL